MNIETVAFALVNISDFKPFIEHVSVKLTDDEAILDFEIFLGRDWEDVQDKYRVRRVKLEIEDFD